MRAGGLRVRQMKAAGRGRDHRGNRLSANGFTLAELTVCVVIVAVLASLIMAAVSRARGKARQSACASNLRQIVTAMRMYAEDHDGRGWVWDSWWPDPESPGLVVDAHAPYVADGQIWFCPSDPWAGQRMRTSPPLVPHWKTSYSVSDQTGGRQMLEHPDVTLACDAMTIGRGPLWHFGGYNVAYADGRVKWRTALYPNTVSPRPEPWR